MVVHYGVACINLTIFVFIFPLNTAFLWIIYRMRSLWRLWAYKILFLIGLVNALMLLSTLEAGLMSLLDVEFPYPFIIMATVFSYIMPVIQGILSTVLALNRFIVILEIRKLDTNLTYFVLLSVAGAISIAIITSFCWLIDYFLYNLNNHGFHTTGPANGPVIQAMLVVSIVCFAISTVLYALAFGSIFLKRKTLKTHEVCILIQVTLPFIWLICSRILSAFMNTIKDSANVYFYTVLFNLIMRSLPFAHVVVYLICNRTLRHNLVVLVNRKKINPKAVVISVTPASHS